VRSVVIERRQHHDCEHNEKICKDFEGIKIGPQAIPKLVVRVVALISLLEMNCRVAVLVIGFRACALKLYAILVKDLAELLVLLSALFIHKPLHFFVTLSTPVASATAAAADTATDRRKNFFKSCICKRMQFSDDEFSFFNLQNVN
jgi:hypothetical protein